MLFFSYCLCSTWALQDPDYIPVTIYRQFTPLPIHPSNQFAPRKYRASWYPALPAKLLAAIGVPKTWRDSLNPGKTVNDTVVYV